MDRTERMITLLQAAASSGDVAEEFQLQISAARASLVSVPGFPAQIAANVDRYINDAVASATSNILASGGDLTTIGNAIGTAFSVGLINGLAIGFAASQK